MGVWLRLYNLLEKECQELDLTLVLRELGEGNLAVQKDVVEMNQQAQRKYYIPLSCSSVQQ